MANRTIQQKVLKMKRMRRAWAVPLQRKSGITPNRIVINQYKESAKGLAVDEALADRIAAEMLLKEDGAKLLFKQKPMGKREAEEHIRRLRHQGELEALLDDCTLRFEWHGLAELYHQRFIYFNARKTRYRILYRDKKNKVEMLSAVYSSKEILITRWDTQTIKWDETRPLPDYYSG